jgi:peptide deformylase
MGKVRGKVRDRARKKAKNKAKNDYFVRRKKLRDLIRKWDDPILKELCSPVEEGDQEAPQIIKEMKRVLGATENGVGLAAPQIGHTVRIIALRPNISSGTIRIMVNPSIMSLGDEKEIGQEGCLSYPGIFVDVIRSKKITVSYEDEEGKSHTQDFEGVEAKIVQHECDHCSGVCLVGDAWRGQEGWQETKFEPMPDEEPDLSLTEDVGSPTDET